MIRTAFFLDEMGTSLTPEEEKEVIVDRLSFDGIPVKGPLVRTKQQIVEYDPEMLILDYGGLSTSYGMEHRAQHMVQVVRNWMLDNPDRYAVIKCTFNQNYYKQDFADYGPIPDNLLLWHWENEDEVLEKIRQKYNIPPVERNPEDYKLNIPDVGDSVQE